MVGRKIINQKRGLVMTNSSPNVNLCLAELGNMRVCASTNLYKVVCVHLKRLSEHVVLERTLWWRIVLGRESTGDIERAKRLFQEAVLERHLKAERGRSLLGRCYFGLLPNPILGSLYFFLLTNSSLRINEKAYMEVWRELRHIIKQYIRQCQERNSYNKSHCVTLKAPQFPIAFRIRTTVLTTTVKAF